MTENITIYITAAIDISINIIAPNPLLLKLFSPLIVSPTIEETSTTEIISVSLTSSFTFPLESKIAFLRSDVSPDFAVEVAPEINLTNSFMALTVLIPLISTASGIWKSAVSPTNSFI